MNELPPWITLRALAVELCPAGRPLNSFKRELRRILKEMGIHRRSASGAAARYWLSDMMDRAPQLVATWEEIRTRPDHSGP